jgi:very-short-patch-repair endonuclease
MSAAEDEFERALLAVTLPACVCEYKFHKTRRWRFDFAWPSEKIAVEIEGRGRHQTFMGFAKDAEKYNAALLLGWRVLRYPAAFVKPGKTRKLWPRGAADMIEDVRAALKNKESV